MITIVISSCDNLGRDVKEAILKNDDLELAIVFTRRDPSTVKTLGTPVTYVDTMVEQVDTVDICINCGGPATNLEKQGPATTRLFNTVDSFDTHSKILTYLAATDEAVKMVGHVSLISTGWDPGLFSMLRVLGDTVLPDGASTTFWGPGISQGRSDAVQRIEGVVDARQYTLPVEPTVHAVKNGEEAEFMIRSMYTHACYVTAEKGADLERIKREIVETPDYFADYDTTVASISTEKLTAEHSGLPHGGTMIRHGTTSGSVHESIGLELALELNPEFTGSVLTAMARVVAHRAARGELGMHTVFDASFSELSTETPEELRAH